MGDPVNAGAKWPNSTLKCETEDGKRACLCGGQCKAHLLGGRVRPGHCCESLALLAQCRGCSVPSSCNVTCTPGSCWKERVLTPRARVGPRPGTPGELRWFVEGPLRPPDLSSQPPCLPDDCKRQTQHLQEETWSSALSSPARTSPHPVTLPSMSYCLATHLTPRPAPHQPAGLSPECSWLHPPSPPPRSCGFSGTCGRTQGRRANLGQNTCRQDVTQDGLIFPGSQEEEARFHPR